MRKNEINPDEPVVKNIDCSLCGTALVIGIPDEIEIPKTASFLCVECRKRKSLPIQYSTFDVSERRDITENQKKKIIELLKQFKITVEHDKKMPQQVYGIQVNAFDGVVKAEVSENWISWSKIPEHMFSWHLRSEIMSLLRDSFTAVIGPSVSKLVSKSKGKREK